MYIYAGGKLKINSSKNKIILDQKNQKIKNLIEVCGYI